MERMQRTSAVEVGDTVAYSKRFLQSTGQLTGDAPFASGQVSSIDPTFPEKTAPVEFGTDRNVIGGERVTPSE